MAKRTKKNSKSARSLLKLEALEQRQLLAGGFTDAQGQQWSDIVHSNGNVYDQVLLKSSSITVNADAGQITRVSFLDQQGDIVQAEFSGAGTLTIALDGDSFHSGVAPEKYLQSGIQYVQGVATFTIQGSDATTNFSVFSVGKGNAANAALFDDTHTGGNNTADVARLNILADPSNPNGSLFGGIRAGNAIFTAESGVVGITATKVHVQDIVRVGDIDAKSAANPALVFGADSQFVAVNVQGGDLAQTNGKVISNAGSYHYQLNALAGTNSAGVEIPAGNFNNANFSDNDPTTPTTKAFTLTTAIDDFGGTSGDDTFNGSQTGTTLVVSALDKIDGGAGNDTLSIADSDGGSAQLAGLTVTNVENFIYTSTGNLGSSKSLDTSGWTGLLNTTITLQNIGAVAQSYEAGAGTAVTINSSSTGTPAQWTITGGKTVNLTNNGATGTNGAAITGVEGTTSVTVTQTTAAGVLGAVDVTDWADEDDEVGTITSVTLNGAVDSTIASNALTNVSLKDVTGTVTIADPLSTHTDSPTALAVATNNSTYTLKDDNGTIKEINFTTSGKKSTVTVDQDGHNVLTKITIAGDQALDLGDVSGFGDKFVEITSTTTGAVTVQVDDGIAVTTAGGNDVITVDTATKKAISTGAGNDWVGATLSSGKLGSGGSIDGGEGTDTLSLDSDAAVTATAATDLAGTVSNFEKLELTGGLAADGTVDLHNIDDINYVVVAQDMTNDLTLKNMASGATVEFNADQSGVTTVNVPVAAIQNETVSLKLSSAADIDAGSVDTGLVTTVTLVSTDTNTNDATVPQNAITLTSGSLRTINVSGNAGADISDSGTGATTINASGLTKGNFSVTTGAVQAAVTITGTSNGENTIDASAIAADKAATITTGGKNDTITVGTGGSTINAGAGANTIVIGGGNNTYTGGGDVDDVTLNGTIGTNTLNLGDGNDKVHVDGTASGQTTINLGGGDDTVDFNAVPGKAGYFVTISGAGNNDKIDLATIMNGTAAFGGGTNATAKVTLGEGVSFADYVNAAAAGNGAGNSIVRWFNYGGDTYVVLDNSDDTTFSAAENDMVIKLTGNINLASGNTAMAIAAGVITI